MDPSIQVSPAPSGGETPLREDLRTALFSELREKGLLDSVKAQLREKVVQELQSLVRDKPNSKGMQAGTRRWGRICMSVLGEYLEVMGLEYTLSVLMIEGDSSREGLMGRGEVEELLGVGAGGRDSVLTVLVEERAKDRGVKRRSMHTQTRASHTDKSGLEEKLQEIERAYSELSEKERRCGHLSMQEKMLSYQRECQRRAREQMKADMARFKERELAALRLDSEDRLQDEVRKSRREFETFYQERLKALQQRERNMMDGMKKRETELDATLYAQRQKILDELESVKNRELQLRRQFETEERGVLGERERLRNLEQELKIREMSLENVNKLKDTEQNEVLMVKRIQLEKEYDEKRKSIEIQEATLREERRSLSQLEAICSQQMKEASELRAQLYKLQEAVRISTEAQFCAEREKQDVIQRVEKMGDYNVLKSENIRLENEAYLAKREIDKQTVIHEERVKDYESRLSDLRNKLHQPSEEVHELRNKLMHENQTRDREQVLNKKVCKQLELRLETSEHQQSCLKDALRDHQSLVRQLTQELTELKVRTGNVSKGRTGRESASFEPHPLKSSLRPQTTHTAPPQLISEYLDPLSRPKSNRVRIKLPSTPDPHMNDTADVSHSLSEISFVQEAKSSLERLEREAQELEQSYKNVHKRILRGATMDDDPIHSLLAQYQQPLTSTIDPRTLLSKNDVVIPQRATASLTSLSDVNLTAGVDQSLMSESDKFSDLVSSCTPLDALPLLPLRNLDTDANKYLSTLSEPLGNILETSILAENLEPNEFVQALGGRNVPLHPTIETSAEEKEAENSLINLTLHSAAPQTDVISPLRQVPDIPLITLEPHTSANTVNTNIHAVPSPPVTNNDASMESVEHRSFSPGFTAKLTTEEPWMTVPTLEPIETVHEVVHTDSSRTSIVPVRTSELEREREEAIREAIQEAEQLRKAETQLPPTENISDTDILALGNDTVENTGVMPVGSDHINHTGMSQIGMDTHGDEGLNPVEIESISHPTTDIPLVHIAETPKSNTGIVPVESEPPVKPVENADTMAMYMQLLSKESLLEEEQVCGSGEGREVSGGFDATLKSEEVAPVSVAGFSETDQTDPFADW